MGLIQFVSSFWLLAHDKLSVDRSLRPKDHEMRHREIRSKADADGNELCYKNLNKIRKGNQRVAENTPGIPEVTNFR